MDKEFESLILKYKTCLDQLSEINKQVEKVNSSEQVLVNHQFKKQQDDIVTTTDDDPEDPNDKLNQILNKLKLDVDIVLSRRMTDATTSKLAVKSFIDNTLWNLFSRTELQNNALLFNNDPNRRHDKNCLMKMIITLIDIDKLQLKKQVEEQEEIEAFFQQLHDWMTQIITIYLYLCSIQDKIKILQLLTTTIHISTWAIPLIQFNHVSNIDDYINILVIVFKGKTWAEDDYLAVLDQLAIDYTFNKLVIETSDNSTQIFASSKKITDILIKGIHQLSNMTSLVKRLSQTIIQMSIVLVDAMSTQKNSQEQIDTFLCELVYAFYDLKASGWFFLPNIPFKAFSIDALWDITVHLLQIKSITKPTSLDQVLNDHLPNMSRFQYELGENQIQGFFMSSCLTNIATCIPSGVHEMTADTNTLSACIVTVISYSLFTIAFVDKQLRGEFYKDVRDNLNPICKYHTFIISLLFRWTVQHISVMERMALYLFHSLNLDRWVILNDDLKLLHQLLSSHQQPQQQTAQILLAKYVIEHLNFGHVCCSVDPTTSKSQPWHSRKLPFLGYDIHEEIAFILLDACQKVQPLPETPTANENKGAIEFVGTMTSAVVSSYLPIADQILLLKSTYTGTTSNTTANEFIDWAWSIALRLKLYDCPVSSRATDIEKSIALPFLRLVLNSYNDISSSHSALLVYISFMLSATSRHFLRFESGDGWMKLLTILKRGKSEAMIQIFSEIVPSFVYMHGDDFFNDESLVDFFKHMIEFKSDPMLVKAVTNKTKSNGIEMMIGSHIWQAHLIDSVSNLCDEKGLGFSYVDLVLHSWLKTVFRKTDWMWHNGYVHVVDILCKLAFTLHRYRLVYHILVEEQKHMQVLKLSSATSSPRITRFIKNMIPATDGTMYATLVVGEWSLLKANMYKGPGVEHQMAWFAFEALVMETVLEEENRDDIMHLIQPLVHDQEQLDLSTLYNNKKKPLDFFVIYRWLQHILVLPVSHVLFPLYLQMFFSLYYQRIVLESTENDRELTMGSVFFNKKPDWVSKLRDYIASAQTFYGQKLSGGTILHAEVLQRTYYAMWLWLGHVDLLSPNNLPAHYDTERLALCHGKLEQDQPWHHVDLYWLDLVEVEALELEFLQFSWEGSDKFRLGDAQENQKSIDDSISLSTTSKKTRWITGESTIVPLPCVVMNDPATK